MNHSADCSLAHSHLYLLILTLEFLEKIYAYVYCPGPVFFSFPFSIITWFLISRNPFNPLLFSGRNFPRFLTTVFFILLERGKVFP